MTRKDVLELRRRLKKDECTFTRMRGCYVDGEKNKLLNIDEIFLNLKEEEFFKYLEIAKKVLSASVGDHMLSLNFTSDPVYGNARQEDLQRLKSSALKDEAVLDTFYDAVIHTYHYVGNYLILLFHDAYDVMTRTNDNLKLDESEEVYEYVLCAICPVTLSKPGLGYRPDENRIGARERDWIVEVPECGFVYPAFSERSADSEAVMYYVKNPKDSHEEVMADLLGCEPRQTVTEQKMVFQSIIKEAAADAAASSDECETVIAQVHEALSQYVSRDEAPSDDDTVSTDPVLLTRELMHEAMTNHQVPEAAAEKIEAACESVFSDQPPWAENMVDNKVIEKQTKKKLEKELAEVTALKKELAESAADAECIILKLAPEKAETLKSEYINGQKYLMIPLQEHEKATVNGVSADF